jgi:hypothetical protein
MPTITIHKPADLQIIVIDGEPPVDRTAEVVSLTAERDTARAERDALQAKLDALNLGIDKLQGQA